MTSSLPTLLQQIVSTHKQGTAIGLPSICSAHPSVLEAAVRHAQETGAVLLVESTSNQVNQYGGYTGMTPATFRQRLMDLARRHQLPTERIILGGDHLGPNPWRRQPAKRAMEQAQTLVRECVLAGYTKIHLDASMRCADDATDTPLPIEVSAARAAALCAAAEEAYAQLPANAPPLSYVIGTEVPAPGGEQEAASEIHVSSVADTQATIELTRQAFLERGLASAWERVIAVVVQPGVEFGDEVIFDYRRDRAAPLSRLIEGYEHLVYEAHSTDYQTGQALRQMVEDHFAILKVGPALTFAFREAVLALTLIEEALIAEEGRSHLRAVLERVMVAHPEHWQAYYRGTPAQQRLARLYSFSDRIRYYWARPEVQAALDILLRNLGARPVPLSLLSQALPVQYRRVREGRLARNPRAWIRDKITEVLADYAAATGTPHEKREE